MLPFVGRRLEIIYQRICDSFCIQAIAECKGVVFRLFVFTQTYSFEKLIVFRLA